jgi:ATP/maltotriose-dependent transcriptional regulator MalT
MFAREFAVREETIKHHLARMFDKVGVSNRLELAMVATECGLLASFDSEAHSMCYDPLVTSG